MMTLLWIVSLIATNAVAVALAIYVMKSKHRTKLEVAEEAAHGEGWDIGYDQGWNSALDSTWSIKEAHKKLFDSQD